MNLTACLNTQKNVEKTLIYLWDLFFVDCLVIWALLDLMNKLYNRVEKDL